MSEGNDHPCQPNLHPALAWCQSRPQKIPRETLPGQKTTCHLPPSHTEFVIGHSVEEVEEYTIFDKFSVLIPNVGKNAGTLVMHCNAHLFQVICIIIEENRFRDCSTVFLGIRMKFLCAFKFGKFFNSGKVL